MTFAGGCSQIYISAMQGSPRGRCDGIIRNTTPSFQRASSFHYAYEFTINSTSLFIPTISQLHHLEMMKQGNNTQRSYTRERKRACHLHTYTYFEPQKYDKKFTRQFHPYDSNSLFQLRIALVGTRGKGLTRP